MLAQIDPSGAANIWAYASGVDKRFRWGSEGLTSAIDIPGIRELDVLDSQRDEIVRVARSNELMYMGLSLELNENKCAVDVCSEHDKFTFGAVGDGGDARWQGESSISKFELDGLEVPDLPRVVGRRGREVLDVSGNVGRWFDTFGARLWAGSRMWFGKAFDPVIPLDRVRSLPVGEVSDGPNGGVRVRLFEPGDSLQVVRERQRAVVEWLGFRRLEEHAEQIKAAYPDRFSG